MKQTLENINQGLDGLTAIAGIYQQRNEELNNLILAFQKSTPKRSFLQSLLYIINGR